MAGTTIDAPYTMRALHPSSKTKPYSVFEVLKPIDVESGVVAPWFGEKGGGVQHLLPKSVKTLLEEGAIRRIPVE